jgi:ABC-type transporter MlaC component
MERAIDDTKQWIIENPPASKESVRQYLTRYYHANPTTAKVVGENVKKIMSDLGYPTGRNDILAK